MASVSCMANNQCATWPAGLVSGAEGACANRLTRLPGSAALHVAPHAAP